jgi:hypothetical protein
VSSILASPSIVLVQSAIVCSGLLVTPRNGVLWIRKSWFEAHLAPLGGDATLMLAIILFDMFPMSNTRSVASLSGSSIKLEAPSLVRTAPTVLEIWSSTVREAVEGTKRAVDPICALTRGQHEDMSGALGRLGF